MNNRIIMVMGRLKSLALAAILNVGFLSFSVAANIDTLGGWNVPVRYAFVTDKDLPKLAVFDTYEKKIIYHVALKGVADAIDISPQGGFLIYAKRFDKTVYTLNLDTGSQEKTVVQSEVKELDVHAYGKWLAYESNDKVVIKDLSTGVEKDFATDGEVSMLFSPTGDSLFISELKHGKLTRINLPDLKQKVLMDLGQPMSPVSIMPNMMALHFSADKKVYRFSLLDDVIEDYPKYSSSQRPYVTSESRSLLTLNNTDQTNSQLLIVNNYSKKLKASYPLDGVIVGEDNIFTGWLEKTVIVTTQHHIESIDLLTGEKKITPISGKIIDKLVEANSKELLATVTNSSKILLFNMKTQAIEALIETGLPNPNHILMGQTATLCH